MVKFINHMTNTVMWVHESRVAEYMALGHRPAEQYLPPAEPAPAPAPAKPAAKKKKKKPTNEEW